MSTVPVAIGMTLCDYVIVEEKTKKVSLIGSFTGLRTTTFPTPPREFSVFAALTDGLGHVTIDFFPSPGIYQFTLLANGEWLAQRLLQVQSTET